MVLLTAAHGVALGVRAVAIRRSLSVGVQGGGGIGIGASALSFSRTWIPDAILALRSHGGIDD